MDRKTDKQKERQRDIQKNEATIPYIEKDRERES